MVMAAAIGAVFRLEGGFDSFGAGRRLGDGARTAGLVCTGARNRVVGLAGDLTGRRRAPLHLCHQVQPRRGAFPEIIERTGGGLIVEADDGEALADGLLTIWTDPERAAAIGEAGAAGVREHYTVGRMADEAESVYRSVMSRVS